MKKRIFALLLALVMVLGMVPANLFAVVANAVDVSGTEIPVADNVIDITDKAIGSISKYYANAVSVAIDGAGVKQAFEDGLNIYVVLESSTAADAALNVTFNTAVNKFTVDGAAGSVTLSEGAAELSLTLDAKYNGRVSYGKATYRLIFQVEEIPTEVPTRLQETDSASTYNGVELKLDLSKYFKKAETYYLVDGESKTALEGKYYTFLSQEGGDHTLVFAAANSVGECPDYVTVTVAVTAIESGIWIGRESSNGSLDYVLFSDADGNKIDGLIVSVEGTGIKVLLPQSYDVNGKVTAEFSLTQNGSLPLLTTKTATSGTTNSRWDNSSNVFTKKTTTLSSGKASLTFYYCNQSPKNESPVSWTLSYEIFNNIPALSQDQAAAAEASITAGEAFILDLTPVFADAEGDALTYLVSINGAAAVAADASYSFTTEVAGEYTLVFTANDGKGASTDTYTVTLTVENVKETDSMTVSLPEGLEPRFYISPGFEGGIDQQGDAVEAVAGETAGGMTAYTVSYPTNAAMLSVRTDAWGGMAFPVEKDGSITLRQVQLSVADYEGNPAASTNTITYEGSTAVAGSEGWLLVTGKEYTYTAVPTENTDTLAQVTEKAVLEAEAGVYTRQMVLNIQNPLNITVPTGAKAQLYRYKQYYSNEELDAKIIKDNGNGTTTFSFVADTKANGANYIYRVTMAGKLTKAGWMSWGQQNLTITYTDSDKAPSWRLDDYSGTGAANSTITEDSVLLNINSRNHLSLSVGQTRTLKAYRAWEVIPVSYNNYIIPPEFTYTILSGSDVVSLTEKKSPSAGDGDWMTLTALKEGLAVIEVTYNAMQVSGGSYDGVYGASDPARSGIVVVQVGGGDDSSVSFGIDGFSSIGKAGSSNVSCDPGNKRAWDAEFDTLYFTGTSGELKLSPTAASAITEVAVSHDKGATWNVLTGENGTYTAAIVSGNNILRVRTASGTAYQVVRGDRITVSLKEVDGKSDGDGIVEAGETVRVTLQGLHNPIPKMAGNYNPGYQANYDGYSSQHLNYTANGEAIYGIGAQYNFITAANYVDVVMPEDGSSVTLIDGYIGLGVIGLTGFADGGDSHRNIPDGGCGTRGSATSYHTRSILPEITIEAGGESAPNTAPIVRADAATEGNIYDDQKFALNPDTLFQDADGDTLTFTVSVNGGEAAAVGTDYKFIPEAAGTYTLKFIASDGEFTAEHTVTVTVTERPQEDDENDQFDLEESEIAGYVTISFEDKGVRVEGEKGLKFPVPLGTIIEPTKVPYKEGENIAQVTKRLLDHLGIGMKHSGTLESGFYLGAITNFEVDGTPYDSMAEFDAGVGSGWMITQNGTFINQGASEFKVSDGDILKWQYTCQLGADIGDDFYAAANAVIRQIDEIGEITLDSGAAIQAVRDAYDKLTESEKQRVSNYQKLLDAEAAYAALVKTAGDEAAAKAVDEKIAAIGTVSLDSEEAIRAAREAYAALTDTQRALVEKLSVLEEAEKTLELLKLADTDITGIYRTTGDYLAGLAAPVVGTINGEWRVIGLARAGKAVPDSYYEAAVRYVEETIGEDGRLHAVKSTDNSRLIVALTAIGKDVTDVGGHDLLAGLNEMEYIGRQGINGTIWALIAFDTHDYEIPAGDVTREKLVAEILSRQLSDGGWALSGSASDPDMTGMALQALAPYYSGNSEVKKAVDRALAWISGAQNQDGTFTGSEGITAESLAQVITGLTALGINPENDSRFIKNGVSTLDALSQFYVEGGGFKHDLTGGLNRMATEQGYYALVSYYRLLQSENSLYDMSDVTIQTAAGDQTAADAVEALIDAIGTVSGDSVEKIKAARDAYDTLTDAQKRLVENYRTLTDAETKYAELVKTAEDEAAARAAEEKIAAIGTVTLDSEEKIKAARKAYDALTDVQKALVRNYRTLTDAEGTYAALIKAAEDEAAADAVEALIDAIGTVSKNSGEEIKAARDAYDKLTGDQKKLVENYKTLTDAETKYKELNATAEVSFTLLGCYKHDSDQVHTLSGGNLRTWIAKKTYQVEPGATVKDVLEMALKAAGMTWRNPTGNYVESVDGIGEFTNGSNSGWMYTLNGVHPGLGVAEQTVKDGDVIVFHYTDDYTREAGGSGFGEDTAIRNVEDLIDAIGTVTLSSKDKLDAARRAYDNLTYAQKQDVSNYRTLTDGEAAYAKLKQAEDEKKADAVEALIDKIDARITLDSEAEISAARRAYDNLSADQKKLVYNYFVLTGAEYDLALLKADEKDRKAAEAVETLIGAIGTVSLDSEGKIRDAREEYDKLTDTQKALVKNYPALEVAEEKLDALKNLEDAQNVYRTTGDYLETLGTPAPGSVGGEWMVIGLLRSGRTVKDEDGYYDAVVKFVQENIDEKGRLHDAKSTENARIILALTAMGRDVTNVGGHNLLTGLNSMEYVRKQGINGPIWTLLALDSGNYPVPQGDVTREALIRVILDAQLADGGWALSGSVSDPDMTGMALQALAPYCNTNPDVKKAVEEAIEALSLMQAADGSFASIDGSSSESVAQVIAALSALGIDADTDPRFVKNGVSALDALCAFHVQGGGFRHIPGGDLDGMATEQGYYALAAYFRMQEGRSALFHMTDVVDMGGNVIAENPVGTQPAETEPAPTETVADGDDGKGGFPWWLVMVIAVLAGSLLVVVIISRPRKRGNVR